MDKFFTPTQLAKKMVKLIKVMQTNLFIADFAAGEGELLKSAWDKWPNSKIIAIDIDKKNVTFLKKKYPNWVVGNCNFLNEKSRFRSKTLKLFERRINVALLNPPFSCRGAKKYAVNFLDETYYCGQAMAFLVTAISYMANNFTIIALLPSNSVTSEKDTLLWERIKSEYSVRIISHHDQNTFKHCSARTIMVIISQKEKKIIKFNPYTPINFKLILNNSLSLKVELIRGSFQMHKLEHFANNQGMPLIHTSNITSSGELIYNNKINYKNGILNKAAVLIPRIGKPSVNKIILFDGKESIVISDCIFALALENLKDAKQLHSIILQNWERLRSLYKGTCAAYLTKKEVISFIINICPNVHFQDTILSNEFSIEFKKRSSIK